MSAQSGLIIVIRLTFAVCSGFGTVSWAEVALLGCCFWAVGLRGEGVCSLVGKRAFGTGGGAAQ